MLIGGIMTFFIRKGINFGPVRVNFSKSGIGLSLGGKGLRVGAGPKGAYIQGGRHGLYYRRSLSNISGLMWGLVWVIALVALAVWAFQKGIIVINL